jgi:hypothetical protein
MIVLSEILNGLFKWYTKQLARLDEIERLEKCELLLCASDLGIDTSAIRRTLIGLLQEEERLKLEENPLLHSVLVLLVFTRFQIGEDHRRKFLEHWFGDEKFMKHGLFIGGTVVSLALQNQQIVNPTVVNYAREWFLTHKNLKSDKLVAWAPFCLQLAGYLNEAKTRAIEALGRREKNGSWGNDPKRSINCAYALVLSKLVSREDLINSIDYIISRYKQGIITELPFKAQMLRLFHVLGLVPLGPLTELRDFLTRSQRIFLSYSRIDMDAADKIVTHLEKHGFNIWIDRDMTLGEDWPKKLASEINASDGVLMLISNNSLNSDYCLKEIVFALKKKKPVVAIHLDRTILPDKIDFMLGDIQRISMTDYINFDTFIRELENGLKRVQNLEKLPV